MNIPPEHKFSFGLLVNLASVIMTVVVGIILASMWAQARDSKIAELDRRVIVMESQNLLVLNELRDLKTITAETRAEQRVLHKGQLPNGNGGHP